MPISSYRTRRRVGRFLAHVFLLGCTVLFAFPFYWLAVSAFKSRDQIFELPPRLLPDPWLLGNFVDVYNGTMILRAFMNSTIIAAGYCLLSVFLCSLGGYAFAKFPRAPGRGSRCQDDQPAPGLVLAAGPASTQRKGRRRDARQPLQPRYDLQTGRVQT